MMDHLKDMESKLHGRKPKGYKNQVNNVEEYFDEDHQESNNARIVYICVHTTCPSDLNVCLIRLMSIR
jgi:hypothetical protein